MKIEFYENGPAIITGSDLAVMEINGEVVSLKDGPIAICRCGQTDNTPFCSGAHVDCDYKAMGLVLREGEF